MSIAAFPEALPSRISPVPPSAARSGEREIIRTTSGCLYGDSTPFPYGGHFIETIRHAVDCGVALMTAQSKIVRATQHARDVEHARQSERARLEGMAMTVKRAIAADVASGALRAHRTGTRILEATRIAVESELSQLEAQAASELAKARLAKDEARVAALRAVEAFVLRHDLPGTQLGLQMLALETGYISHALVSTPFGVETIFELDVPLAHEWGKLRQVRDLTAGVEVHVPLESGLFFKRLEVQTVKLDKLFLASIHLSGARSAIVMRRQPCAGPGYRLEVITPPQGEPRAEMHRLLEDGSDAVDGPLTLGGDDAIHALRLWQRVVESTADLATRRSMMTSALVDGRALKELDEPGLVCERLVAGLAPTVREIAKRSGAPGELVLRRDVCAGQRDEVYITKAELHEKVLTLPPAVRKVFEPFELDSAPRSPRAPAPSLATYVEGEIVEEEATLRSPPQLPPARYA